MSCLLIPWVSVFLCVPLAVDASANCSLIINELQLTAPSQVHSEFIELKTNCPLPLSLSDFSLLLWHGPSKGEGIRNDTNAGESRGIQLISRAQFGKTANCADMTHPLLVIGHFPGNESAAPFQNGSEYQNCSFADFGSADWKVRPDDAFIDTGRGRTNALVLYRGLNGTDYTVNVTSLNNNTAQRDKIVDLIFFARLGAVKKLM